MTKPKHSTRQKDTEWREVLTYDALVHRGVFNNRMSLKRAMDKYGFPRPYKLGERRVAWSRDAVDAWLASRRQNAEASAQQ